MSVRDIAPGSILQRLYLAERLRRSRSGPGRFVELGAGTGAVSKVLLDRGWEGRGYDLNAEACRLNAALNAAHIAAGRYDACCGDFLEGAGDTGVDLVASCMVLEHMEPADVERFFDVAVHALGGDGVLMLMVPGSMRHWGIEDEVAGHQQRFDQDGLRRLVEDHGLRVRHVAGLTYPLSNWLLPLSNRMVARSERAQMDLSPAERTIAAGRRNVPMKTVFPRGLSLILNGVSMYPFHLLQKAFRRRDGALIIYLEAELA